MQSASRRTGARGTFDRFDNLAIARVAADALGTDLDRSGLIDRARADGRARHLLNRHRLRR